MSQYCRETGPSVLSDLSGGEQGCVVCHHVIVMLFFRSCVSVPLFPTFAIWLYSKRILVVSPL